MTTNFNHHDTNQIVCDFREGVRDFFYERDLTLEDVKECEKIYPYFADTIDKEGNNLLCFFESTDMDVYRYVIEVLEVDPDHKNENCDKLINMIEAPTYNPALIKLLISEYHIREDESEYGLFHRAIHIICIRILFGEENEYPGVDEEFLDWLVSNKVRTEGWEEVFEDFPEPECQELKSTIETIILKNKFLYKHKYVCKQIK
jgi:hypothetical protein